jgi:feruloyl esterase
LFRAVGNAGFAGGINYLDMGAGVGYGFATLSTDTGHISSAFGASWAYKQPEVLNNWDSVLFMNLLFLECYLLKAFMTLLSLSGGCSCCGKQGFKEVESFPVDFDGVLAGAPAWWTTHLQLWNGWIGIVNAPEQDGRIDASLFDTIGNEVLKQCDPQDGVVDTIISDPITCNFNPWTLICTNTITTDCLNAAQIGTLYKLYSDWVVANQTFVFLHLQYGSEAQWVLLVGADEPAALMTDYVKYMLDFGPEWNWRNWNDSIR